LCANILQKRLCVVLCGALSNHIFKFLYYCEDLLSVIVVCKARSHDLLSSCIEPSCVNMLVKNVEYLFEEDYEG
jgi:vesicle coat complex subunit